MSRPRGLAILRAGGLAAWMVACPPDRPTLVAERALRCLAAPSSGNPLGHELAPILAAMALASRTSSLEVIALNADQHAQDPGHPSRPFRVSLRPPEHPAPGAREHREHQAPVCPARAGDRSWLAGRANRRHRQRSRPFGRRCRSGGLRAPRGRGRSRRGRRGPRPRGQPPGPAARPTGTASLRSAP